MKSIYDEIANVKKHRTATLRDMRNKLMKCRTDKEKAEKEESAALLAGNVEAYTRAKSAGRSAADQIEFYQIQIKTLEAAPLFDDPEKRKAKAEEIKAGYEELKAEKLKAAAELINKADDLISEISAEMFKANNALRDVAVSEKKAGSISVLGINGLKQRVNQLKDNAELKPYIDNPNS